MKIAELFRLALKNYFAVSPRGAQTRLAKELNISKSNLNDFLKGRKPLSEEKRSEISEYFGFRYEEMIALGRRWAEFNESLAGDSRTLLLNQFSPDLLENIRKEYSLSMKDVADWLGINESDYKFKEKGFFPLSFSDVAIIFSKIAEIEPGFKNPLKSPKSANIKIFNKVEKMSGEEKKAAKEILEKEKNKEESSLLSGLGSA